MKIVLQVRLQLQMLEIEENMLKLEEFVLSDYQRLNFADLLWRAFYKKMQVVKVLSYVDLEFLGDFTLKVCFKIPEEGVFLQILKFQNLAHFDFVQF